MWELGAQSQVLMLAQEALSQLSHLPTLPSAALSFVMLGLAKFTLEMSSQVGPSVPVHKVKDWAR